MYGMGWGTRRLKRKDGFERDERVSISYTDAKNGIVDL